MKNLIIKKLLEKGYKSGNLVQIADWLLQRITGKKPVELLVNRKFELSEDQKLLLNQWIDELTEQKKPLQYILGSVPFCGVDILVEPPVLIPRPETEEWVENLYKFLLPKQPLNILDLCTGSGCIALALAKKLARSIIIGSDIGEQAISLALKNKDRLELQNISFIQSDLFKKLKGRRFDVIIANPPYVTYDEWQQLEPHVKNWEDRRALVAGDNGLALIKKIIQESRDYFKMNSLGLLVLEIGTLQAEAVCTFMRSCGYTDIEIQKDIANHDRVVMGCYVVMEQN